ncbi:Uncharacterized protein TCM_043383, partial [Theobroma cacao]
KKKLEIYKKNYVESSFKVNYVDEKKSLNIFCGTKKKNHGFNNFDAMKKKRRNLLLGGKKYHLKHEWSVCWKEIVIVMTFSPIVASA